MAVTVPLSVAGCNGISGGRAGRVQLTFSPHALRLRRRAGVLARLVPHFRIPLTYCQRRICRRGSAGFQPAVSPTSSRQAIRTSQRLRIGNPRYSRLEVCATGMALVSGLFIRERIYEMEYLGWPHGDPPSGQIVLVLRPSSFVLEKT